MYQQLEALSADRHADLRLAAVDDYRFAAGLSQAPIARDEVVECAKHFPIVFPEGDLIRPVVLLGLRRGHNDFVADDGQWEAGYVPAYLRRYPFVFGEQAREDTAEARYTVMIDRSAPHLAPGGEGRPLFEPAGAGTTSGQSSDAQDGPETLVTGKAVQDAVSFLSHIHTALGAVPDFFAPLAQQDVLVARNLEVYVGQRRANRIAGMRIVDRARVAGLDDAMLAVWARSGLLETVHAHWQSLSNFRRLTG